MCIYLIIFTVINSMIFASYYNNEYVEICGMIIMGIFLMCGFWILMSVMGGRSEDKKLEAVLTEDATVIKNVYLSNEHIGDVVVFNKNYNKKISKENKKIIKKQKGFLVTKYEKYSEILNEDVQENTFSYFNQNINFLLNSKIKYIDTGNSFKQSVNSLPKTLLVLKMNTYINENIYPNNIITNVTKKQIFTYNLPNLLKILSFNINHHNCKYCLPSSLKEISFISNIEHNNNIVRRKNYIKLL